MTYCNYYSIQTVDNVLYNMFIYDCLIEYLFYFCVGF
jgi:hypothetical protein